MIKIGNTWLNESVIINSNTVDEFISKLNERISKEVAIDLYNAYHSQDIVVDPYSETKDGEASASPNLVANEKQNGNNSTSKKKLSTT